MDGVRRLKRKKRTVGGGLKLKKIPPLTRGGATGYDRYALAYPADPACIGVYILYLKKKTLTCGLEN